MGLTPDQRRTNNVAAAYGYRVNEDTIAAGAFTPGDGVIVLTAKGEPVMSGTVQEVKDREYEGMGSRLRVGDQWYHEGEYTFREL